MARCPRRRGFGISLPINNKFLRIQGEETATGAITNWVCTVVSALQSPLIEYPVTLSAVVKKFTEEFPPVNSLSYGIAYSNPRPTDSIARHLKFLACAHILHLFFDGDLAFTSSFAVHIFCEIIPHMFSQNICGCRDTKFGGLKFEWYRIKF